MWHIHDILLTTEKKLPKLTDQHFASFIIVLKKINLFTVYSMTLSNAIILSFMVRLIVFCW